MTVVYNGIPQLEVGDKVVCKGKTVEIAEIRFQDYWGEDKSRAWGFYTEFYDTKGVYYNWKQYLDGGEVIPKVRRLK